MATGTAAPDSQAGTSASPAGKLARFPCGPRTKWIVVVFWILMAAGMGPLAGKLGDIQENDAVNWLPGSAESTKVYQTMDGFKNPNEADGVILLERRSGLTDADRQYAQDLVPKLRAIDGVHADVQGPFESADHQGLQFTVPYDMGDNGDGWKKLPDFVDDVKALDVPNDGLLL